MQGNRSTRRKPTLATLCPPQIPLDQTGARTRAAAVGTQWLIDWTMARPFDVLTAAVMESTVIWDITPCSPLKVNRRFGRTYRLHVHSRTSRVKRAAWRQRWRRYVHPKRRLTAFVLIYFSMCYLSEVSDRIRCTPPHGHSGELLKLTEKCTDIVGKQKRAIL
jgi:hypothetical protein